MQVQQSRNPNASLGLSLSSFSCVISFGNLIDRDHTQRYPKLQGHTVLRAQSCPTLWHPMDCSPPGSFVDGILQARILEWGKKKKKHTGVGCHALLQGVFPSQGSNSRLLRLLHRQVGSLPLSHLGSLRVTCLYVNPVSHLHWSNQSI